MGKGLRITVVEPNFLAGQLGIEEDRQPKVLTLEALDCFVKAVGVHPGCGRTAHLLEIDWKAIAPSRVVGIHHRLRQKPEVLELHPQPS